MDSYESAVCIFFATLWTVTLALIYNAVRNLQRSLDCHRSDFSFALRAPVLQAYALALLPPHWAVYQQEIAAIRTRLVQNTPDGPVPTAPPANAQGPNTNAHDADDFLCKEKETRIDDPEALRHSCTALLSDPTFLDAIKKRRLLPDSV